MRIYCEKCSRGAVISDAVECALPEHWTCTLPFLQSVLPTQTRSQGRDCSCGGGQRAWSPEDAERSTPTTRPPGLKSIPAPQQQTTPLHYRHPLPTFPRLGKSSLFSPSLPLPWCQRGAARLNLK